MASISLPLQPQSAMFSDHRHSDSMHTSAHRHSSRRTPLPNPAFVFPARDPDDTQNAPVPELHARVPPPLPAFSFNPGGGDTSPSSSPLSSSPRGIGHRRQCSEFVGSELPVESRTGVASDNNDKDTLPGPANLAAPGPGFNASRHVKRHAHRRSGAVTSVDLAVISKDLDMQRSPSTSADANQLHPPNNATGSPRHLPVTSWNHPTPPSSPGVIAASRNSLSDDRPTAFENGTPLERPISTVSVETSDSLSTVRPTITAQNTPPPRTNETAPISRKSKTRPKTADASFMLKPDSNGEAFTQTKRPVSASGHSHPLRLAAAGLLGSDHVEDDGHSPRPSTEGDYTDASDRPNSSESASSSHKKASKSKKRQKKVRSWAGAILTRGKGKRHHSKKDTMTETTETTEITETATKPEVDVPAPILTRTNSDMGSGLDVDFDDDNIVILRTPTDPSAPEPSSDQLDTHASSFDASWKPKSFYEQTEQESGLSPIIDLDAALGPFNTPERTPMTGTGFSIASRRMYSGGRRGEFVGPEMRYHRRTESAPEMPPDRSTLHSLRFAGTSSMVDPDVLYEEEEEDAFSASGSHSLKAGRKSPVDQSANLESTGNVDRSDNRSVSTNDTSSTLTRPAVGSDTTPQNETSEVKGNSCLGSPAEETNPSEPSVMVDLADNAVEFSDRNRRSEDVVKRDGRPSKTIEAQSPDISPRFIPFDKQMRPSTDLPHDLSQLSLQAGTLLHGSSPDLGSYSCDTPRSIATPPTDRQFLPSASSNEGFADFSHPSVEDVPSLTSSASTMTNNMHRFSPSFFPRMSTDRSRPFPSRRDSSQSHRSKRSSLVSLSKLVGHHAEKSKLSHEEKPPREAPEKTKKGRRVSRLMQFWKTDKEKSRHDSAQG